MSTELYTLVVYGTKFWLWGVKSIDKIIIIPCGTKLLCSEREREENLLVDVWLGDEGVKNVENAVNVPHLLVLLETQDLLGRPSLQLPSELDKRLELQPTREKGSHTQSTSSIFFFWTVNPMRFLLCIQLRFSSVHPVLNQLKLLRGYLNGIFIHVGREGKLRQWFIPTTTHEERCKGQFHYFEVTLQIIYTKLYTWYMNSSMMSHSHFWGSSRSMGSSVSRAC